MQNRVLGVLAGGDLGSDLLKKWAQSATYRIAADAGADRLLRLGIVPEVIVGDLDSISPESLSCGAEVHDLRDDQGSTDCDKLLRFALHRSLLPITIIGLEGDRVDHMIASLYSAAREPFREKTTFAFRKGLAWVLGPGAYHRSFPGERTVSILSLGVTEGLHTRGLRWKPKPVIETGDTINVSNVAPTGEFHIKFASGLLLLIVGLAPEEMPVW